MNKTTVAIKLLYNTFFFLIKCLTLKRQGKKVRIIKMSMLNLNVNIISII